MSGCQVSIALNLGINHSFPIVCIGLPHHYEAQSHTPYRSIQMHDVRGRLTCRPFNTMRYSLLLFLVEVSSLKSIIIGSTDVPMVSVYTMEQ